MSKRVSSKLFVAHLFIYLLSPIYLITFLLSHWQIVRINTGFKWILKKELRLKMPGTYSYAGLSKHIES